MKLNLRSLFFILSFFLLPAFVSGAQEAKKAGYLEVKGRISKDRKPLDGVEVSISKNGKWIDNLSTSNGGKFKANLDMNSEYLITFKSPGCYNKSISISTYTEQKDLSFVWTYSFAVDLIAEIPGFNNPEVFNKPVAKVIYRGDEGAFNYDEKYTSAAQSELTKALNAAMAKQNSDREKRRQDSLNNLKAGAEARAKAEAEARQKHRMDSIAAANKAKQEADRAKLLSDQRSKQRADSLAKIAAQLRAKQVADSIAKAKSDALAKSLEEKQRIAAQRRADSTAMADAARKAKLEAQKAKQREDSITKAEAEAKIKALERAKLEAAKHKADSVAKAFQEARERELAEKIKKEAERRAKQIADSTAQADALRKKQEEERLKQIEKARADSIAHAQLLEQQKREALEKQKAAQLAEQAKKEPDSFHEETLTEKNRTIKKTTIVQGGVKNIWEMDSYNWGGIFYFQNGNSISKETYDQGIETSRKK